MQQPIHFARASDGVTIAYSTFGNGHPLLLVPGWISHLELDMENPEYAQFIGALSQGGRRRLIRLDFRGTGLSDREVSDTSVESRARDIDAVVESLIDHTGFDNVAIFAWSMGGPAAIAYAAAHPERVSHLMLHGTLAHSDEHGREALGKALVDLIRADWRIGSRAIVEFVNPNSEKEVADNFTYYARNSASGEVAADLLEEALFHLDVRDELKKLTMPTLVLHRRDDQAFPLHCGRDLASLLPHAHFIPLPGSAHAPFYGDFAPITEAIGDFLATSDGHTHGAAGRTRAADRHTGIGLTDAALYRHGKLNQPYTATGRRSRTTAGASPQYDRARCAERARWVRDQAHGRRHHGDVPLSGAGDRLRHRHSARVRHARSRAPDGALSGCVSV